MLKEEFEVGGFMAQRGLWNIVKKKMLEDRGQLPQEEGDLIREYNAVHENIFSVVDGERIQKIKQKKWRK